MSTKKYDYNPWPLGQLPKEFQRPEPELVKQAGYQWDDPRDIIDICENKIAEFFGAKYAVTVDCCSHAIFLSLQYLLKINEIDYNDEIICPQRTYISVAMQIIHTGLFIKFEDIEWRGYYYLRPTRVIDAAVMWEKNSYIKDSLMCLSFQIKKMCPTGKMGAILTDNKDAYEWLKLASYDGRNLTTPYNSEGHVSMVGWHYYATPEDCARTILLMDQIKTEGRYMGDENYPIFLKYLRNYESINHWHHRTMWKLSRRDTFRQRI